MNARDLTKRFTEAVEHHRAAAESRLKATAKTIAAAATVDDETISAIDRELASAGITRGKFVEMVATVNQAETLRQQIADDEASNVTIRRAQLESAKARSSRQGNRAGAGL